MQTIARVIEQVSDSDVTVLIRGESGVGKELVARAIHQRSSRKDRPFVKVNCAALPGELLESELFGHEKGAFTGAATTRIGKFEQADTGTIFLDEIGEMKAALQAKLLHVLQDAQFTKLGSNKTDQRRRPRRRGHQPRSREDDAARRVPRGSLLPAQGHRGHGAAAARAAQRDLAPHGVLHRPLRAPLQPARGAARPRSSSSSFRSYEWPGNIRELENMIKRMVILQDEQLVVRELVAGGAAGRRLRGRRRSVGVSAPIDEPEDLDETDDDESPPPEEVVVDGAGRPAGRRRQGGRAQSRARDHRGHAAARCSGIAAAPPSSSASATRPCSTRSRSAGSAGSSGVQTFLLREFRRIRLCSARLF